MQLFLIRHTAPEVAPGVCYGQSDLGLRESPAALAAAIAAMLPPATTVFTSPLQRCSALAIAIAAEAAIDDRLAEMDFGDWELQPWNAIARDRIDRWADQPFDYVPPGGESAMAMATRVIAFARERLSAGPDSLAVVSHHGPLRVLAATVLGEPRDRWLSRSFDLGTISLIETGPAGAGFRYLNCQPASCPT